MRLFKRFDMKEIFHYFLLDITSDKRSFLTSTIFQADLKIDLGETSPTYSANATSTLNLDAAKTQIRNKCSNHYKGPN